MTILLMMLDCRTNEYHAGGIIGQLDFFLQRSRSFQVCFLMLDLTCCHFRHMLTWPVGL